MHHFKGKKGKTSEQIKLLAKSKKPNLGEL